MLRRTFLFAVLAASAVALVVAAAGIAKKPDPGLEALAKVNHIVVIYEENHSFDNLYGGWEGVNGLGNAANASAQVNQNGKPFSCLMQQDVNLTAPSPLATTCTDTTTATSFTSHFTNTHFSLDSFLGAAAATCPNPGVFATNGLLNGSGAPGGCTRDIVHRYYQEQFQIDNGKMDRYVQGSDATGLAMGTYDTTQLPIYKYLHETGHPKYAILDNFFQGAFGGSFLNHQLLVAGRAPTWVAAINDGGADDLHSVVDGNGMPNNYPLYASPLGGNVKDQQLTASCNPGPGRSPTLTGTVCGDYAVNTTQPFYQPYSPGTAVTRRIPPLTNATIGDRLSAAGVDWAWYSGGWSNANGDVGAPGWTNGSGTTCSDPGHLSTAVYPNCPDADFQFHHQAFNYYANFAPGTQARKDHLKDQASFTYAVKTSRKQCNLKSVSFVKPIGEENEHPGYASESNGSSALVSTLKAIEGSACAKDTMVVVTYDEFGGQWDHVAPPGTKGGVPGPHDIWGPGTRIPALVVSPALKSDFVVDHVEHDTLGVLTTIERRWKLAPLTPRDGTEASLATVFDAKQPAGV